MEQINSTPVSTDFDLMAHYWPPIDCLYCALLLLPEIDENDQREVVNADDNAGNNLRGLA